MQLNETAVYWCEQAANLSHGDENDNLKWAESLINAKQYHRAAHILKQAGLETKSWRGCFLTTNALFLSNNLEDAFKILETSEEMVNKKALEESQNSTEKDVSKVFKNLSCLALRDSSRHCSSRDRQRQPIRVLLSLTRL